MKKTISLVQNDLPEGKCLFNDCVMANTFFSRLKGLLGKKGLKENEALLITPCKQVHTIGMKFVIDIIFVDRNKEVTKVVENLGPFRQANSKEACFVIEVAAGMAGKHSIKVGDQLAW